jgi:hypothetical protein
MWPSWVSKDLRWVNIASESLQKTVHQNKIEAIFGRGDIVTYISDQKLATVTTACILDVTLIEVNSKIFCVSEILCVCAWTASHVKYTAHATHGVMCQHGREFLARKWCLPSPID